MRHILLFLLLMCLGIILQLTTISRINILNGSGDLILVIICAWAAQEKVRQAWVWGVVGGILVGLISAAPLYIYVFIYTFIAVSSRLLLRRIWQAPLMGVILVVFLGSILSTTSIYIFRFIFENYSQSFGNVFIDIILPSVLINMIMTFILHPVIVPLAKWATELDTK